MKEQEVFEIIKLQLARDYGVDAQHLSRDTDYLRDLGMDSLDTIEYVMNLEENFEISLTDDEASQISTLGQAAETIARKLSNVDVPNILKQEASLPPPYDENYWLDRHINGWHSHLHTPFEQKVFNAELARIKARGWPADDPNFDDLRRDCYFGDEEVEVALGDMKAFRKEVVERILREQNENLKLNRCPNCKRLARSTDACQCFWCGNRWNHTAGS